MSAYYIHRMLSLVSSLHRRQDQTLSRVPQTVTGDGVATEAVPNSQVAGTHGRRPYRWQHKVCLFFKCAIYDLRCI